MNGVEIHKMEGGKFYKNVNFKQPFTFLITMALK